MGTVVLSPQDCLASSPNRQNYYFSTMVNTSYRESIQGRTPSSSPAEDCVRTHSSGGPSPGDGLLPAPQPHGQARTLPKKSSPSESSSSLLTPPSRRSTAAFFTRKSKLSRSTSAILPTPLSGSPPLPDKDRLHIVEGRLPFKIVQGNGPGDPEQISLHVTNKSTEKCIARKNSPGKCGKKVKEHFQGREGLKSSVERHSVDVTTRKQVIQRGRSGGSLEKSRSGKNLGGSCIQTGIPVVTILQRPKNEEAAAELIAKYFMKSDEQTLLFVNDEAPRMPEKHDGVVIGSEAESSSSRVSDSEGSDKNTCNNSCSSMHMSFDVLLAETTNDVEGLSVDLTTVSHLGIQEPSNVTEATVQSLSRGSGCDDATLWERWAGPCYANSPPPSALPLPRFSKNQTHLKCGPLVSSPLFKETISDEASTIINPTSTVPSGSFGHRDLTMELDTFATATKDLKRILNLDLRRI